MGFFFQKVLNPRVEHGEEGAPLDVYGHGVFCRGGGLGGGAWLTPGGEPAMGSEKGLLAVWAGGVELEPRGQQGGV